MTKFFRLSLLIALSSINIFAQQRDATISFKEKTYDFGAIKAADGPVSHVFEFTNTGSTPLIIQNVQASCGCTTPEWTKQPVMPGTKGIVKVSFNPEGRSGQIDKTITVTSNASTVTLNITGSIIPKPITPQEEYLFPIGELRFKQRQVSFNDIAPESARTEKLEMINTSTTPVKIAFGNVPAFITAKAQPELLQPNQKGYITITYDAAKKHDWGFQVDYVYLVLNDKKNPESKITITATIKEDFSKLTPEQLANAPKISYENTTFDFGSMKEGQKAEHVFKFKNEGKSNLKIRKVETSCGCTIANSQDQEITPGASSTLSVVFNSSGKSGMQNKVITVITNDPKNPSTTLLIKGMVEAPTK